MNYKHISLEERHYIEKSRQNDLKVADIANHLDRHKSTIFREIKRNTGKRGYRNKQANNFALERIKTKVKKIKLIPEITVQIDALIRQQWSPEQVAGYLKKEGIIDLHHETIYRHILRDKKAKGDLYLNLRHQNKTYRKRYGNSHTSHGIKDRIDISELPEQANKRQRVGDWEGDTIIGKNHKGAIVTLDERVSKLRLAIPTGSKKAEAVTNGITSLLTMIKSQVKTLTLDNGKEFSAHKKIAKILNCSVYFAQPYHSWERGQNENANGLLRQYFPKTMELIEVSKKAVFEAVDKLNSRPRKCLDFKTPYEVFEELTGITRTFLLTGVALIT